MKLTVAHQCSKWTLQCIYVDSNRKHGNSKLKLLIPNSSTSTTKKSFPCVICWHQWIKMITSAE